MKLGSDSVVTPNPNFVNFKVASVNATDELGSVSVIITIFGRPISRSDWCRQGHDIEETTADRVIEIKAKSEYILKMSLKLWKKFKILGGKVFL